MWPFTARRERPIDRHIALKSAVAQHSVGGVTRILPAREGRVQAEIVSLNPLAYLCVHRTASAVSQVKFRHVDESGNAVAGSNVTRLLERVNVEQGTVPFLFLTVASLAAYGNAYWRRRIGTNFQDSPGRGRLNVPGELFFMQADRVTVRTDPVTGDVTAYEYTEGSRRTTLDVADVMHIRQWWLTDEVYGLSPIVPAASSLATYDLVNRVHHATAQNGGASPGALVAEGGEKNLMTDEDMQELTTTMRSMRAGGDNAGKLAVLNAKGGTLKTLEFPQNEATISIERQNHAQSEVAAIFGIPPILLRSGEGATFENQREARIYWWQETLVPTYVRPLEDALTRFLGVTIKADLSEIPAMQDAQAKNTDAIDKATTLTVDEKRAARGYEPLADKKAGGAILVPSTTTTLDEVVNGMADDADPALDDAEVDEADDEVKSALKACGCS